MGRGEPHSVPGAAPAARALSDGGVATLTALAALALGGTIAPAVYGPGDAPSLTLALATAGVPHPTGYPLWTLTGHAFVRLLHAAGLTWAHAANLWSAVGAALAVGLFVRVALRLATLAGVERRAARVAALSAASLLAIDPVWIASAAFAEVNAWHWAWLAWGLNAALAAITGPSASSRDGGAAAARRSALLWGLVWAVGLAHHRTALAFLLPLTAAIALARLRAGAPMRAWSAIVAATGACAAIPYGWTAWRAWHTVPGQWPLLEPAWSSVWAHARGGVYLAMMGGFAPSEAEAATLRAGVWIPLAAALAGLTAMSVRARGSVRAWAAAALAGAALQCGFVFFYGVPDPSNYFVPPLLAGLAVWPALVSLLPARHRDATASALAAVACAAAVLWLPLVLRAADQARTLDRNIRTVWDRVPPGPAIVLWQSDQFARLRAFQLLEGRRPDVVVDDPDMLTWEPARRAFERRTGVDPLRGLTLRDPSDVARIPANVARQSRLPVLRFEDLARGGSTD